MRRWFIDLKPSPVRGNGGAVCAAIRVLELPACPGWLSVTMCCLGCGWVPALRGMTHPGQVGMLQAACASALWLPKLDLPVGFTAASIQEQFGDGEKFNCVSQGRSAYSLIASAKLFSTKWQVPVSFIFGGEKQLWFRKTWEGGAFLSVCMGAPCPVWSRAFLWSYSSSSKAFQHMAWHCTPVMFSGATCQ